MAKINISIPQPCHENWDTMSPESKGRFCDSCQKKVFDFTQSSDREIVTAFQQNNNLCGRFLDTQLDRDLVKPERKNPVWLATTSVIISLVGLNEVAAQQEPPKTEQTPSRVLLGKPAPPKDNQNQIKTGEVVAVPQIEISGIVTDSIGEPLPGANIIIKGVYRNVKTDFYGKFHLFAKKGDVLHFSYVGFKDISLTVNETANLNIQMKEQAVYLGGPIYFKKRTFFGRIFHSIGNLFR